MTMTAERETIVLGLGEMQVVKGQSGVLACIGLGSCIAIATYDPVSKVGGMAHMVLSTNLDNNASEAPAKYINKAIPLLLYEMYNRGAVKSRIVVKITGGAQILSIPGLSGQDSVAQRNIIATKEALAKEGLPIAASDVGGDTGRTARLFLDSGKLYVKTTDGRTIDL